MVDILDKVMTYTTGFGQQKIGLPPVIQPPPPETILQGGNTPVPPVPPPPEPPPQPPEPDFGLVFPPTLQSTDEALKAINVLEDYGEIFARIVVSPFDYRVLPKYRPPTEEEKARGIFMYQPTQEGERGYEELKREISLPIPLSEKRFHLPWTPEEERERQWTFSPLTLIEEIPNLGLWLTASGASKKVGELIDRASVIAQKASLGQALTKSERKILELASKILKDEHGGIKLPGNLGKISKVSQSLPEVLVENKLPYQVGEISAYKRAKQIKLVANELAESIGKPPKDLTPIVQETLKEGVGEHLKGRAQGFLYRTYRMEPLLEAIDKYVQTGKYAIKGGKFSQTFWNTVNKAKDAKLRGIASRVEAMRTLAKQNNVNFGKWWTDTQNIDGIQFTASERIGLYLHRKNADNIVHVVFGNNIPMKTIDNVANSLTPAEKTIADYMFQVFQEEGPKVASAHKLATGKVLKLLDDYVPIRVQARGKFRAEVEFNQTLIDEAKLRAISRTAASKVRKGFTLPRSGRAMQPINIDGLGLFFEHINGVEHYKNFLPVVRDLQAVLGSPVLKRTIMKKLGNAAWDVMNDWVVDISKSNPLAVNRQIEAVARGLRVNAVTSVLGFNITTALKQFPSYISGMAESGEMPAIKGLFMALRHPKDTAALIKRYSPQISARVLERELAESQLFGGAKRLLTGKRTMKEWFMILTTTMDRIAVSSLWRGTFDDYIRKGFSSDDAAKYAERVIRRTQPFFDIKDVPEYWRSGELAKALTMFTNQLNQYWNYYIFHIGGRRAAGKISNLDVMKRVAEVFVIPALMIGAISRSRPANTAKEYLEDFGSMAFATVPILGNTIASAIRGYFEPQGIITTEFLDKIQKTSYHALEAEWAKVAQTMPEIAAILGGIPAAQPIRTTRAIVDMAQQKSDDWLSLIWGTYTRQKAGEGKEEGDSPFSDKINSIRQRRDEREKSKSTRPSQISDRIRRLRESRR